MATFKMILKILAFGITKDIFGTSEKEIEINEGASIKALKELLKKTFGIEKIKILFYCC
jgi:molybdopterin synthase sulfur carrier subunit